MGERHAVLVEGGRDTVSRATEFPGTVRVEAASGKTVSNRESRALHSEWWVSGDGGMPADKWKRIIKGLPRVHNIRDGNGPTCVVSICYDISIKPSQRYHIIHLVTSSDHDNIFHTPLHFNGITQIPYIIDGKQRMIYRHRHTIARIL